MSDRDGTRDRMTGRFLPGTSGNRNGRPRKHRTADEAILDAVRQPIVVTENGRAKKRSKLDVAATQLVNQSAQGVLAAGKLVLDLTKRAEEGQMRAARGSAELTPSDREIADRVLARLRRLIETEKERNNDNDADSN